MLKVYRINVNFSLTPPLPKRVCFVHLVKHLNVDNYGRPLSSQSCDCFHTSHLIKDNTFFL